MNSNTNHGLFDQMKSKLIQLEKSIDARFKELKGKINATDAELVNRIDAGDAELVNRIDAGDAELKKNLSIGIPDYNVLVEGKYITHIDTSCEEF